MFRSIAAMVFALASAASVAGACELPGRANISLQWALPLLQSAGLHSAGYQGDGFGMRRHPILNVQRLHTGQDWVAPVGTSVRAAANGLIVEADRKGEFGNYIRIVHGGGWETTYAHLQRFDAAIKIGACVAAGQPIGQLGNTGLSAGPHLHFELIRDGTPIDPLPTDKR